uniref:Serpentine receptor class gamma n=1 Tax=Panagrellus redivivus TaxID=6233 RepID=A0A7E4VQI3_PANRE
MDGNRYIAASILFFTVIVMIPFDIFFGYHIAIKHKILFNAYFITYTAYLVNGTLYTFFAAYLTLWENNIIRIGYQFYQYFIPLLSVMMALNRFTAIVVWTWHKRIPKWTFFVINGICAIAISVMLLFVNHIGIFGIRGADDPVIDKVFARGFKAAAYLASLIIEVVAVLYRKLSKKSQPINSFNMTLLIHSLISTVCWIINFVSNQMVKFYGIEIFDSISNVALFCGFVLPTVYLFIKIQGLHNTLIDFCKDLRQLKLNRKAQVFHKSVKRTTTSQQMYNVT